MNDLDHMLNGNASHHHHQDMIRQAQQQRIAREAKRAKATRKTGITLPAILTALIGLLVR